MTAVNERLARTLFGKHWNTQVAQNATIFGVCSSCDSEDQCINDICGVCSLWNAAFTVKVKGGGTNPQRLTTFVTLIANENELLISSTHSKTVQRYAGPTVRRIFADAPSQHLMDYSLRRHGGDHVFVQLEKGTSLLSDFVVSADMDQEIIVRGAGGDETFDVVEARLAAREYFANGTIDKDNAYSRRVSGKDKDLKSGISDYICRFWARQIYQHTQDDDWASAYAKTIAPSKLSQFRKDLRVFHWVPDLQNANEVAITKTYYEKMVAKFVI